MRDTKQEIAGIVARLRARAAELREVAAHLTEPDRKSRQLIRAEERERVANELEAEALRSRDVG